MKRAENERLKRLRKFDKEDSQAGIQSGRWLWDASRELRDSNLRKFWAEWDKFSILTPMSDRYKALIDMTKQVYLIHTLGKLHNRRMRNRFELFKESDFPLKGRVCGCCGGPAEVRHHIVPIKNGGHSLALNLIPLCNVCHIEIHPWMAK